MFKKISKGILEQEGVETTESFSTDRSSHTMPPSFSTFEGFKNKALQSPGHEVPDISIAENSRIEGVITFDKLAKIDGHFSGEIISKGKMIIGATAVVQADLFLEEADISGHVEGNISVTKKLTLSGHAKITGDITAPSIHVEEGVSIRGQLHVMKISTPVEEEEQKPFSEGNML
jgi:cytoskeletal protein CcmA (bactofilin family)